MLITKILYSRLKIYTNEMKNNIFNSRKWHYWIGILLSLPIFIVGITGFIFSFQDSFKNKPGEPQINTGWLPGYSSGSIQKEFSGKNLEIKSSLLSTDGTLYFGTGNGLFFQKGNETGTVPGLSGMEIRSLAQQLQFLFIGSKMGLFKKDLVSGELQLVFKKDIHDINIRPDSTIVVSDNKTLFTSADFGKTWEKVEVKLNATQLEMFPANTVNNQKIPLHKFMMDLHTGKAFFGKAYEAIWMVLVGLSITLLSFTGVLMWVKRKRQMRKYRNQNSF